MAGIHTAESRRVSLNRRDLLRLVSGATAFAAVPRGAALAAAPRRKTVLVTFGGGARDDETFAVNGQRNIPHLLNELVPQGTFFTQVINRGILGHYVATAGITTGSYETFNNFVAQPPEAPTLFEYFRRQMRRPAEEAWVIAPSIGFRHIGASSHRSYGPSFAAEVIIPKHILSAVMPARDARDLSDVASLLQDNYESPLTIGGSTIDDRDRSLARLSSLRISVDEYVRQARTSGSSDQLSVYVAERLMESVAPSLLMVTLHDMDVAHTGTFSLYLEGIQRSDRLCAQLWRSIQANPEYKDRTTLLILPDFGRDADGDPGGNGFQHHRTGSAIARTTWMLALGPNVRQNATVDRPIDSIDVAPTIGGILGFDTPFCSGTRIAELL